MIVYLFMIFWIVLIGFISKGSEVTEIIGGREEKRSNYTYAILSFSVVIIFTGLRNYFGDTGNYMAGFNRLDVESTTLLKTLKESDGYQLFHAYGYIMKKYVSTDYVPYLFGIALFSGACTIIGYRRYSCDYTYSLLLFMLSGKFTWMMNGIKQYAAAALIFMALKYTVSEKKRYKYFLYTVIAYFIHPSAVIMLPVYFIIKAKPWSAKILITIGATLLSVTMVSEFTDLLNFLTEDTVFEGSTNQFASDDGANILRFFVAAVPPVLALIKRREVEEKAPPVINVMINMSVIAACCYLIATFTSGILVGRVPLYFELSGYALIPWLFDNVYDKKDSKLLRIFCLFFYAIYFYVLFWGIGYASRVLNIYKY